MAIPYYCCQRRKGRSRLDKKKQVNYDLLPGPFICLLSGLLLETKFSPHLHLFSWGRMGLTRTLHSQVVVFKESFPHLVLVTSILENRSLNHDIILLLGKELGKREKLVFLYLLQQRLKSYAYRIYM